MADEKKIADSTKSDAILKKCGCEPSQYLAWQYQEQKYGKGIRAHNPSKKGWVCTVCQKISG
jgi:hypothetical protein